MKPETLEMMKGLCGVKQTKFYDPQKGTKGNCMQAAVASLLGLKLDDVPNFIEVGGAIEFWMALEDFAISKGFECYRFDKDIAFDCHYIASGKSARGIKHSVIYKSGELVFDPHPDNTGIENVDMVHIFIPIEPHKYTEAIQTIEAQRKALEVAVNALNKINKRWQGPAGNIAGVALSEINRLKGE